MREREILVRHPLAIFGALLATVSAVGFVTLALAMLADLLDNPYAGIVVFVLIPAFFALGLLLIPAGMWLQRRKLTRDPAAVVEWPVVDLRRSEVRRATLLILALTCVNVVIILLAGYGSLHAMESPAFCGQTCHTPMTPQFTAWQNGSHAHVACVKCHISEGAAGFVHAKLNGTRQLAMVVMNSYPRPIAPGAKMPPGAQAQTCLDCHRTARSVGDVMRVVREYADDDANTETVTVLQMHVTASPASAKAIHWHADPATRVEYVASGDTIPLVRVTDAAGQVKEYVSTDVKDRSILEGPRRTMDCIDCHNTVGHPIAQTAERAVDDAIGAGRVDRRLPHVRGEGVKLLAVSHANADEAAAAIEKGVQTLYASNRGGADPQAVARTSAALQDVFRGNVFPAMKVTWGSYPTNKGHVTSNGCFRCHDGSHEARDGSTINADCEYCHKQVEQL